MIEEKTVIVALAMGRTFANLQENPIRMKEYATSGPQLDMYKSQTAKIVGEQAADMIKALATFEVTEVRPLIDRGQGWEKSI
jgi:hypothetical protein